MTRAARLVIWFALASVLVTGCWDARGLEQRGFVVMAGVDKTEDGQFRVSLQTQIGRSGRKGGDQASGPAQEQAGYRVITSEGETIEAAVGRAAGEISRELDLSLMDVVVFGESAVSDLAEHDFFARSTRFPVSAFVAVTRGDAETVVRARSPGFQLPGRFAAHGLSGTWTRSPAVVSVPVWTLFQRHYFTPLEDPYAPTLTAATYGLTWDGLAVFREHSLAGFLTPEEATVFNVVRGRRRTTTIEATVPGKAADKVALSVDQARARRWVSWTEAGPVLHVDVRAAGAVQEMWRTRLEDPATQAQLERALAKVMAGQIRALIGRLQGLGSDPIGFGELARRANPNRKEVQNGRAWHTAYGRARLDVSVRVEITSTGYMK